MKYPENIQEVAALQPDYLGFIFYEKSKRYFEEIIPSLPKTIKKVGIFVDVSIDYVNDKIKRYQLDVIQLHGIESPEFCSEFYNKGIKVIKVFSVGNQFYFKKLAPYESVVDYFLFDTKGEEKGGNGVTFNWTLLENYPSDKPYFLSGGIGLESLNSLKKFWQSKAAKNCYALDVNSRFEDYAGMKNIDKLKEFKDNIK
ncbi:MAG: phosphoribosylanthranilate isomerase [Flavobacteriaceae bacterium]